MTQTGPDVTPLCQSLRAWARPLPPSRAAASSHLRSSTAARGFRGAEPLSADADLSLLVPPRPDKTCAHEDRGQGPFPRGSHVPVTRTWLGRHRTPPEFEGTEPGLSAFPGYAATLGPRRQTAAAVTSWVRLLPRELLGSCVPTPHPRVACGACLLARS